MSPLAPILALSLVLAAGCATPAPAPGPALPNGPQAQAMALRVTWAAFQEAVRDGDRDALVALWSEDAPGLGDTGTDGEGLADTILMVAEDPEVRDAILSTRAQDLDVDGQRRVFRHEMRSVDPDDGTEYESGVYVYFVIDPDDARVYLVDTMLAG